MLNEHAISINMSSFFINYLGFSVSLGKLFEILFCRPYNKPAESNTLQVGPPISFKKIWMIPMNVKA